MEFEPSPEPFGANSGEIMLPILHHTWANWNGSRTSEKDWRKSFDYIQLIIIISNYHYDNMKEVLPSHNLLMDIALSMFDL